MSQEITLTASLSAFKTSVMSAPVSRFITGALFDMTGNFWIEGVISVAITATAIPLGQITQPGYCYFKNLDGTNFIRIMNGSGGAKVPKLRTVQIAIFPWDDTATPYAIADTAACLMEYVIFSL